MITTVQKWGNSHGVRIPKSLLEKTNLKENDQVEVIAQDGSVLIQPVKKHRTLGERIADHQERYQAKEDYQYQEWATGTPKGNEVL